MPLALPPQERVHDGHHAIPLRPLSQKLAPSTRRDVVETGPRSWRGTKAGVPVQTWVRHVGTACSSTISTLLNSWGADVDGDGFLDSYDFTRRSLVVSVMLGGQTVQFIVMHTKSNFVNKSQQMWSDPATHQNYIVAALLARRQRN